MIRKAAVYGLLAASLGCDNNETAPTALKAVTIKPITITIATTNVERAAVALVAEIPARNRVGRTAKVLVFKCMDTEDTASLAAIVASDLASNSEQKGVIFQYTQSLSHKSTLYSVTSSANGANFFPESCTTEYDLNSYDITP